MYDIIALLWYYIYYITNISESQYLLCLLLWPCRGQSSISTALCCKRSWQWSSQRNGSRAPHGSKLHGLDQIVDPSASEEIIEVLMAALWWDMQQRRFGLVAEGKIHALSVELLELLKCNQTLCVQMICSLVTSMAWVSVLQIPPDSQLVAYKTAAWISNNHGHELGIPPKGCL